MNRTSVARVLAPSLSEVEYLCKMINLHEHCNVSVRTSLQDNVFELCCTKNNNLCRNVLLSLEGTPIMRDVKIIKERSK